VLDLKPHFSSAKFELLPYLVRKQFLSTANLSLPQQQHHLGQALSMSSSVAAARATRTAGSDRVRCCCFVVPHDAGYCMRACSIAAYMQANLDICRGSTAQFDKAAEPNEMVKEGNFVLKSISADSARGAKVEVGARSSIKKSAVGNHCKIGAGVRLANCVLMEGVVVHDKVNMSNCILCKGAEVLEGASLKDAQVGSNVTVEAGMVIKGEALTALEAGAEAVDQEDDY
jgi:translation initiation factor eIF-2B subunit gamma